MDYVNSGRGNVQPLTLGSGPSEIKAYEPSWTERIESSVQSGLMSLGMDRYQALQLGRKVGALGAGVGSGLSGNDSYRGYASGHPVLGSIHAVGVLPLPGAGRLVENVVSMFDGLQLTPWLLGNARGNSLFWVYGLRSR